LSNRDAPENFKDGRIGPPSNWRMPLRRSAI
jgi:hypothetical protein